MDMKGFIAASGLTKKEKKEETVYTHHLKVANKNDFKLSIDSGNKEELESIKKEGSFEICPADVIVTIRVELQLKKEKFDKDLENTLPGTGDPWYKLVKTVKHDGNIKDTLKAVERVLEDNVVVEFV